MGAVGAMLGMSAALRPPAGSGLCAGMAPALLCCSTATIAAVTGSFPAMLRPDSSLLSISPSDYSSHRWVCTPPQNMQMWETLAKYQKRVVAALMDELQAGDDAEAKATKVRQVLVSSLPV